MSRPAGLTLQTTISEIAASMGSSTTSSSSTTTARATTTAAPTTTAKAPCYYTFTGKRCPGPAFNQCPAGSRCDIDVGWCVAPAPGRTDCITDYSKRGPVPTVARGGRRRYGSRKSSRGSSGRSRKLRRRH